VTEPDIAPGQLALVRAILAHHLPGDVAVWVFGSRATGKAKPFSDLDLALAAPQPLPAGLLRDLAEAFDDSDLPWKVDLLDWADANEDFRRLIERDRVPLSLAE